MIVAHAGYLFGDLRVPSNITLIKIDPPNYCEVPNLPHLVPSAYLAHYFREKSVPFHVPVREERILLQHILRQSYNRTADDRVECPGPGLDGYNYNIHRGPCTLPGHNLALREYQYDPDMGRYLGYLVRIPFVPPLNNPPVAYETNFNMIPFRNALSLQSVINYVHNRLPRGRRMYIYVSACAGDMAALHPMNNAQYTFTVGANGPSEGYACDRLGRLFPELHVPDIDLEISPAGPEPELPPPHDLVVGPPGPFSDCGHCPPRHGDALCAPRPLPLVPPIVHPPACRVLPGRRRKRKYKVPDESHGIHKRKYIKYKIKYLMLKNSFTRLRYS